MEEKTSLGLQANVEATITNLLAPLLIPSIVVLVIEKESKFVRFYAMQSLVVFLALTVVNFLVGIVPLLGGIAQSLISLVSLVAWIYFMYAAYTNKKVKVPTIGDIVDSQINK